MSIANVIRALVALCLGLGCVGQAQAALWCGGMVASTFVSIDGNLTVDWGYQPIWLCNVNADTAMPAPQQAIGYKTCQSIYSMALTAQSSRKQFMALLPNDSSCAGLFNGGGPATKLMVSFRVDQ